MGLNFKNMFGVKRGLEVGMCVLAQSVMGFAIGDHSDCRVPCASFSEMTRSPMKFGPCRKRSCFEVPRVYVVNRCGISERNV